jgi:stage II sporulation protein GA (sporulation sigma-E factor processing peptidase)
MIAGTFVASAIVLLLFTPLSGIFNYFFGKLIYSMLIIWVVFGFQSIKNFLKALSLFYLSAFMIGGGLFAIHYYFQNQLTDQLASLTNMSYGDPISWIIVIAGFPILWFFSKKQLDNWVVRKWKHDETLTLRVKLGQETWAWSGRVDSGNSCKDPFSQRPVLFVQAESLPESLSFLHGNDQNLGEANLQDIEIPEEFKNRVTFIPFQTVSHELQYAPAVRADQLVMTADEEQMVFSRFYIMCSQAAFSTEEKLDCLLHPDMVLKALTIKAVS